MYNRRFKWIDSVIRHCDGFCRWFFVSSTFCVHSILIFFFFLIRLLSHPVNAFDMIVFGLSLGCWNWSAYRRRYIQHSWFYYHTYCFRCLLLFSLLFRLWLVSLFLLLFNFYCWFLFSSIDIYIFIFEICALDNRTRSVYAFPHFIGFAFKFRSILYNSQLVYFFFFFFIFLANLFLFVEKLI